MEPIEEWRAVHGYEGIYEVSDQGRIRSLTRIVQQTRKTGVTYSARRNGVVLKPGSSSSGHLHVVLQGRVTRTVHSLVAEAFLGPRPEGYEVRHKNGQPDDCRAENLEYGTRADNSEDSKRHGTHFHASLTHCKRGHELTPENIQRHRNSTRRTCLACRRERQQIYNEGKRLVPEGFCPNGHPKTPENRYTNGAGASRCKPCANKQARGAA